MGDKSVETLGSKILFWSVLVSPQNNVVISISSTAQTTVRLHRPQCLYNIELGGRGYQRINARCKVQNPANLPNNRHLMVDKDKGGLGNNQYA